MGKFYLGDDHRTIEIVFTLEQIVAKGYVDLVFEALRERGLPVSGWRVAGAHTVTRTFDDGRKIDIDVVAVSPDAVMEYLTMAEVA